MSSSKTSRDRDSYSVTKVSSILLLYESLLDLHIVEQYAEEEKEQEQALTEEFEPLLTWLKEQAKDIVRDGMSLFYATILLPMS